MKYFYLVVIALLGLNKSSYSQCIFKAMFPIEHGITKFKASNEITRTNNFTQVINEPIRTKVRRWEKPHYLNGDSILKTGLSYNYKLNECFMGNSNTIELYFVDDHLYKMLSYLTFDKTRYTEFSDSYENLVSMLKMDFPFYEPISQIREDTKEQISEGYLFYKNANEDLENTKVEYLRITYEIKYEPSFSTPQSQSTLVGNISEYEISIDYINLYGTKLTTEGY